MRLNKLEELKTIQAITKIKPLTPLSLTKIKIEMGVSNIDILCLMANINYGSFCMMEDNPPSARINAIVDHRLGMIGKLFKMMDNHLFLSQKEFKEIKKSMSIKGLK